MRFYRALISINLHALAYSLFGWANPYDDFTDHRVCKVLDGEGETTILFCKCGIQFFDRDERTV